MNRRTISATISSNLNDKKNSNHPDRTQSRSLLPQELCGDADIPRIVELAHVSMGHSGSFSGLEDFDEQKSVIQPETTSKTYGSTEGHRSAARKLFQSPPPSASISTLLSSPDSDVASRIVIYFCVLISDVCRGVLFPTLWLLIYSLGGTKATQGMVVAAFSAGRILGSPLFGYWSEQYGFQKVLIICNAIIIIGTFLYAISGHVAMVIVAQLVIGFGAGSLGATRGYIAEKATVQNRTSEMAYLTSIQYAGFTVTPIIGAMISSSFSGDSRFTMPAFFIGGGAAICIIFLLLIFRDVERSTLHHDHSFADPVSHVEYDKLQRDESKGSFDGFVAESTYIADEENKEGLNEKSNRSADNQSARNLMIAGCVLNFVTKGVIAIFETLTVMFVSKYFHWDTIRLGITISLCGLIGVVFLLFFPVILKYIQDTDLIVGGMFLMLLSCTCLVQTFSSWASERTVYAALILMFALGYPIGHTALIGAFSKLSKSGPQGKMMGMFGSFGSLARIIFPLCSGVVVQNLGFDWAFGFAAVLLMVSLLIVVYFRKSIIRQVHDQYD